MRLTVLGQMVKGAWTDAATVETKAPALDRIKWLLWHGNAPDAVDDIECMADDVTGDLDENPASAALSKLATAIGEFATYIANNMGHIVNYGERLRAGERISTGFVESAINQIVDILGFTMVGAEAGEVMAVVQMAMLADLPYPRLRDAVLAHPTMAEGLGSLFSGLPKEHAR